MLRDGGGGWQRWGAIPTRLCLRERRLRKGDQLRGAARTWYQKASEGGGGYAQRRLGCVYEKSELDLAIDLEAARTCYQEAAEGGDAEAQGRLDEANERGELDQAIDLEAARTWYHKAAESGNRYAQR